MFCFNFYTCFTSIFLFILHCVLELTERLVILMDNVSSNELPVRSLLFYGNIYILKLQAAMEGTSPGSPPTGGFRKTGNSEQYAFKMQI